MGLRTRKLLGSLAIAAWLVIYALGAMAIIGQFDRPNPLWEIPLYAVVGVLWILPLKPIFVWMGRAPNRGAQ